MRYSNADCVLNILCTCSNTKPQKNFNVLIRDSDDSRRAIFGFADSKRGFHFAILVIIASEHQIFLTLFFANSLLAADPCNSNFIV
jgi:hypothetical protein